MGLRSEHPYGDYPEHPLHNMPTEILEAARKVLWNAAVWKDVDGDQAEPIADAVVAALKPWIAVQKVKELVRDERGMGWERAHTMLCPKAGGRCEHRNPWQRTRAAVESEFDESADALFINQARAATSQTVMHYPVGADGEWLVEGGAHPGTRADCPKCTPPDTDGASEACTCSPYFGCSEYAPDCPRHGGSE